MSHTHYTVLIEPEEEGGYHAFCPALPGCHTQGESVEETLVNIHEAVELYLESMIAHGEKPPQENYLIKPVQVEV
ncbi:MAG: type II toxin-antitoxin system HicB family antitoxin [bacterium]|nr:type II toxin-antitoxin system HicB family antitoxin [bacterium]